MLEHVCSALPGLAAEVVVSFHNNWFDNCSSILSSQEWAVSCCYSIKASDCMYRTLRTGHNTHLHYQEHHPVDWYTHYLLLSSLLLQLHRTTRT